MSTSSYILLADGLRKRENLLALGQQNHFRFLGLKGVFSTFIRVVGVSLINHILPAWRCLGWVYTRTHHGPWRELAFSKIADVLTQDTWDLQEGCISPKSMGMGTGPEHHCDPMVLSDDDQGISVSAMCLCLFNIYYIKSIQVTNDY